MTWPIQSVTQSAAGTVTAVDTFPEYRKPHSKASQRPLPFNRGNLSTVKPISPTLRTVNDESAPNTQRASQGQKERVGIWAGLREVYGHMTSSRRRQFLAVLGLMIAGGVAEVATIGSLIPFLSFLAQTESAGKFRWPANLFASIAQWTETSLVMAAALVFGSLAISAGALRLTLTWMTQDFIYRLGHELALDTQRRILAQSYSFHIERNTSTMIAIIDKIEILVLDLVFPLMQALTSGVIAAFIIAILVYIDPFTAVIAAASFSIIYLSASAVTSKRLTANSAIIGTGFHERLKIVQESLGGIRDIIIDKSQSMHLGLFARVNEQLATARATTAFIGAAPRYLIETVGITVIAAIAVIVSSRSGGIAAALPVLGAIALGAQRLLPLIQSVYTGWSTAAGHRSIVAQVLDFLRLPTRPDDQQDPMPLPFRNRISFQRVSFSYPSRTSATAIRDVSFDIPASSMVALVGETGGGKSTIVDLLMALLEPTEGRVTVDGTPLTSENAMHWQRNIAHVPQFIFLADASIASNIALAFDDEPIDMERVIEVAKMAQLDHFVSSLPNAYDTRVGELGIRLSGGQRQRLGLARALYKRSPLLVLDEATSALDEETEAAVMECLDRLSAEGRTIVIIAHRRSTISSCDVVLRLRNGSLVKSDSVGKRHAI